LRNRAPLTRTKRNRPKRPQQQIRNCPDRLNKKNARQGVPGQSGRTGVGDFIEKPFADDLLIAAVRSTLNKEADSQT
jgi:hypothetical protein